MCVCVSPLIREPSSVVSDLVCFRELKVGEHNHVRWSKVQFFREFNTDCRIGDILQACLLYCNKQKEKLYVCFRYF